MKDPEVGKFRIFVLKFWSIQTKSQLWFIVEGWTPNLFLQAYSYIAEIFEGTGEKDPNVAKFQQQKILEYFRPRVNFGAN